ncbi:MAG: ATPase [Muribaculaceae bacterium]
MQHPFKHLAATVLLLSLPCICNAQEQPKFKFSPSGRILIDGALYASPQKESFPDGVAIPEVRLGGKVSYGKWKAAIEMCYAYSKIGLRDMWIEYDFNPGNSVRIGNFIHQYGLQSTSSSRKATMEQPMASAPFTPGLQLGAMYVHYDRNFYAAASAHVESSALQQAVNAPLFNQQGYSLLTRLVYRNPRADAPIWHVGISGGFGTPQRRVEDNVDIHDGFTVSANFPTKVVQLKAIGTTVSDSKNLFKFTPELLFSYGRMAFESQYFYQRINRRKGLHAYTSQSGYATLRGLILGNGYSYSSSTAQLDTPKPGSLELVVDYNYTSLTDHKAAIFGGRSNSFSATLNYYLNPYITARLNYSYAHVFGQASPETMSFNGVQARLMLIF